MARIAKLTGFVVLVTVINLITILAVVKPVRSTAQNPPCVPGDVNGDFAVDISDSVYLLTFLFDQGPEPIACAEGVRHAQVGCNPFSRNRLASMKRP